MLQVHKDNLNRLRIAEQGFPLSRKANRSRFIDRAEIAFDAIFIGLVVAAMIIGWHLA
jgi:hypothetical protein